MTPIQQQKAARDFAAHWEGKGYEKGESQIFWTTLLNQVFGIEHPETFIIYEHQVKLDHTSFIDGFIPTTKVMIEQKSLGKNLGEGIKQSDGSVLNPFQQAKRYAAELPYSQRPRWIVTCNFAEFWVYDMEQPNGEPQKILLKDLEKEYYRLQFLVDEGNEHLKREMEVSVKAGNLVGIIYDKLLEQYGADDPETLRSLNILCVRLVFCLYAEDAGLFNSRTAFHDYLNANPPQKLRRALVDLFAVLDTPLAERDKYLEDDLAAFPYVNGGLFSDKTIEIPQFTDELKQLILEDASADFDWSEISPTIFGAVFESTLNPETRRSGGMHYTSIENIHKVIDPLFLDELKAEFDKIQEMKQAAPRKQALAAFQDKLATLTFFDPACGSGNFLTETFLSLRRLENKVIQAMYGGENILTFDILIKVNISQFYGIEINDFACTVAKTALWIAESQTLKETSAIAGRAIDFLPLKTNAYIHEGNALRIDWSEVIAPERLNYIMGNPPFVGARWMNKDQKQDVLDIFGAKWQGVGDLDYVCCWYKKAAEMMQTNSAIKAALVSTNSITQGGAVINLWKPLFEQYDIHFDFAYRTFRWDSEADIKAHVHCVILGFSVSGNSAKRIFLSDLHSIPASNINGYLMDAPDMWIDSRNKPICDVPEIGMGNQPIDGGFYLFTESEKGEFITKEPKSAVYFHPWYGAEEFINNKKRYCLWLGDCSPAELRAMPQCYERVLKVREYRLQSPRSSTLKLADNPTHFQTENMPNGNYIVIPEVSSEKRRYIPIGYMDENVLCSNKLRLMPFATLFHFGILTSNVHMSWMRVVCGRLKSDYSYSIKIVYNNFPWCQPTEEQKARIEQTAQAVLDARAKYPDCSLADLYDEVTMPPELRKAHQENDRAVMAAYGFSTKMTESECVAELFKMYQSLTK
ncbi:MAG: class I SAM-dependent DNA methyltransferase [Paludibacteraceae bacterium]|nr:class I SAM-dependent DNA methyltransferase [Paludibacteraceae bacterium]